MYEMALHHCATSTEQIGGQRPRVSGFAIHIPHACLVHFEWHTNVASNKQIGAEKSHGGPDLAVSSMSALTVTPAGALHWTTPRQQRK